MRIVRSRIDTIDVPQQRRKQLDWENSSVLRCTNSNVVEN